MVDFLRADDADAAVAAAAGFGGHVVIKADVPGLLHKTAAGAVELDLHGADEVRAAMRRLQDRFAGRLSGVLVEPIVAGGVETIVGVVQEPVFGPVVVFGLGGVLPGCSATAWPALSRPWTLATCPVRPLRGCSGRMQARPGPVGAARDEHALAVVDRGARG